MKHLYPCSLCKSRSFEKIIESGIFSTKADVVICRKCGLICLNPRWDEDDYDNYYKRLYYSQYMRTAHSIDEPFKVKACSRGEQIYESIKDCVSLDDPILEVGTGGGDNVVWLYQKGFSNISCVEVDQECCQRISKYYQNIKVACATLNEFSENEKNRNYFHLVILSHVAEHFVQPELALRVISGLLDDNGYLLIIVPNIFATKHPYRYFTPPHTHYFSYVTLKLILEQSGLKVLGAAMHQFDELAIIAQKTGGGLSQIDAQEYKKAREFLRNRLYWDDLFRVKIRRVVEKIMSERVFQYILTAAKKIELNI